MNVALGRSGEDNFEAEDHDAKDVLEKVRCMLSAKASQCQTVEGHADQTEDDHTIVAEEIPMVATKAPSKKRARLQSWRSRVFSRTFI